MTTYFSEMESPVGRLLLQGDGQFLTGLHMPLHKHWDGPEADWERSDEALAIVRSQLAEYFAGDRQEFDVPLRFIGTSYQQRVWSELQNISFGQTITYAELARRVGQPTAARAVGHANARNPISIIVPCHRVIGVNGKLTGYAGGLDRKEWLLAWERAAVPAAQRELFAAVT
ncbi:MAG TPA: methylated-DNA--[protein]-cysteine S-methyltransferase [Planctomycetaceae bacterium]|nr:methylated-DNA--[protein]-cysteine S-methyltransferase [Planctomycetaceae bacterium]